MLLLLLNAACLKEKQKKIPISFFVSIDLGFERIYFRIWREHANLYTIE
jgi:hypothetical protein